MLSCLPDHFPGNDQTPSWSAAHRRIFRLRGGYRSWFRVLSNGQWEGLLMLIRNLAIKLAPHVNTVNGIAPRGDRESDQPNRSKRGQNEAKTVVFKVFWEIPSIHYPPGKPVFMEVKWCRRGTRTRTLLPEQRIFRPADSRGESELGKRIWHPKLRKNALHLRSVFHSEVFSFHERTR